MDSSCHGHDINDKARELLANVIKLRISRAQKMPTPLLFFKGGWAFFHRLYVVKTAKAAGIYFPIARYRNITICHIDDFLSYLGTLCIRRQTGEIHPKTAARFVNPVNFTWNQEKSWRYTLKSCKIEWEHGEIKWISSVFTRFCPVLLCITWFSAGNKKFEKFCKNAWQYIYIYIW